MQGLSLQFWLGKCHFLLRPFLLGLDDAGQFGNQLIDFNLVGLLQLPQFYQTLKFMFHFFLLSMLPPWR
jgi:hypothetical protein